MTPIGHPGALRRLYNSLPKAGDAKAVAMAAVTSTSLYCGKKGLERGTNYLVVLSGGRLLILRPLRRPDPATAVLLEFAKGSYRVTDVQAGGLNTSFVVSRPYGNVNLRVLRRAWYAVNDQVVGAFVAAASAAERAAARNPAPPLRTAADVRVFARMCAAHGPGAEHATAAAECEITSTGTKALLAAFPDRLVLLDPGASTHVASTPVAVFARGATVELSEGSAKHLDVRLSAPGSTVDLRVFRSGEDRIDDGVRAAIAALR